ncbi:MAG: secretion protein, partial [Coprobacter sp.]|nr:secretion protein [Coprobacter sp.]
GEPCYNLDVNTSMFKLYAKVNDEIKLMGLTSSWAGMYFSIPVGEAESLQLGVSAVSTDMKSESDIAWSTDIQLTEREINNDIVVSQNVIKPNEPFTVGYLDPKHAAAQKWVLVDAETETPVKEETNVTGLTFPDGLPNVGPYNLTVTEESGNRVFNWFVQITDESTGALPQIKSISLEDKLEAVTIESGESVKVAYTGREADGVATRAISAEEAWVGARMGDTGLDLANLGTGGNSFTIAAWVKYTFIASNGSSCFFSIENRKDNWPQNNWGWFWSNLNADGSIGSFTFRTSYTGGSTEHKYTFPDTKIPLNSWVHVAIVFDFQSNTSRRALLYVNGIKQNSTWEAGSSRGSTDNYWTYPSKFLPDANMYLSCFGGRGEGYVAGNGLVDDLQLWNKALSPEEVLQSMELNRNQLPNGLLCYWDFETMSEAEYDGASHQFISLVEGNDAKASNYAMVASTGEGQAVETPQVPQFSAGNPFLEGTGYTIETLPTWTGRRAIVTDIDGSDTSGSATVTYNKAGAYTLTLTLSNDYGSDTRDYPLVTVEDPVG